LTSVGGSVAKSPDDIDGLAGCKNRCDPSRFCTTVPFDGGAT
jgi:hypothetical protein